MKLAKKGPHKSYPHWRAIAVAVASAALLALGWGIRFAAWPRGQVRLEQVSGEESLLAEFTVSGRVSSYGGALDFLLQDGQVQTKRSGAVWQAEQDGGSTELDTQHTLAVPLDQHDALDAGAIENSYIRYMGPLSSLLAGYKQIWVEERIAWASEADWMYTLRYCASDGVWRSIRVCLGFWQLEEQVFSLNARLEEYDGSLTLAQDYAGSGYSYLWEEQAPTASAALVGDTVYFYCKPLESSGMRPGIYRVDEPLTDDEVEALPKNTTVAGQPVLAGAQPYGRATLLWEDTTGGCGIGLAWCDEGFGMLSAGADGALTLYTFDLAGNLCGQARLAEAQAALQWSLFLPNLRGDELVLEWCDAQGNRSLQVVRLAGGKAIAQGTAEDCQQDIAGARRATLNADGTALLVLEKSQLQIPYYTSHNERATATLCNGWQLLVYRPGQSTTQPAATALLATGEENAVGDLFSIMWDVKDSTLMDLFPMEMDSTIETERERAQSWPGRVGQ